MTVLCSQENTKAFAALAGSYDTNRSELQMLNVLSELHVPFFIYLSCLLYQQLFLCENQS